MKRILILLFCVFLVLSLISCDNDTPAPEDIIPQMPDELYDSVMGTIREFMDAAGLAETGTAENTGLAESAGVEGIGYDENDSILFIYKEIPKEEDEGNGEDSFNDIECILAVDEGFLHAGDIITTSGDNLPLLNGVQITADQEADFNTIKSRLSYWVEREYVNSTYDSVTVGGQEYEFTIKRAVSRVTTKPDETTEAESAFIYSLDKPYDSNNIQEITIYFPGDCFSDADPATMEGDVVIELKGDDSISGLYKATIPGAEQ